MTMKITAIVKAQVSNIMKDLASLDVQANSLGLWSRIKGLLASSLIKGLAKGPIRADSLTKSPTKGSIKADSLIKSPAKADIITKTKGRVLMTNHSFNSLVKVLMVVDSLTKILVKVPKVDNLTKSLVKVPMVDSLIKSLVKDSSSFASLAKDHLAGSLTRTLIKDLLAGNNLNRNTKSPVPLISMFQRHLASLTHSRAQQDNLTISKVLHRLIKVKINLDLHTNSLDSRHQ